VDRDVDHWLRDGALGFILNPGPAPAREDHGREVTWLHGSCSQVERFGKNQNYREEDDHKDDGLNHD
jgi:hypothetical protein